MNEDQNKSQALQSEIKSIIGNSIPTNDDHPLHMLDNQTDPSTKPKKPDIGQKPIRTYESDLAEALSRQKSSVASIAIAESRKREDEEKVVLPSQSSKKFSLILTSLILIVLGLGGGYYLYLQSPLATVVVDKQIEQIPSLIKADTQKVVRVSPNNKITFKKEISNQFNNQEIKAGNITEIVFVQTIGSTTSKISETQFIDSLEFNITDTLKRTLGQGIMTGVFSTNGTESSTNEPFIILKTDFFQNAFAGMLKWEAEMPEELADVLNFRDKAREGGQMASTTASTTNIVNLYNLRGSFKDKVINNRDVREFVSQNGNMLFLYTFLDKDTILITTSESVIPALIERIEKQTYVR